MLKVLEHATTAIVVVTFLGAVFVLLRGSIYKGTITALESTVATLTVRVTTLESDNRDKDQKLTQSVINHESSVARIEALERENASLLEVRPSSEAITLLGLRLEDHHNESMEVLTKIVDAI